MPASFHRLFEAAGVDSDRTPVGMIVPQASTESNYVGLIGGKVGAKEHRMEISHGLKWEEVDPLSTFPPIGATGILRRADLYIFSRVFRIWNVSGAPSKGRYSFTASKAGARKGTRPEATLELAILSERRIPLAIRPVITRDGYHSRQPFDPKALVAQMNAIWKPQANVVFDLVSSDPARIDLPPIVDINEFATELESNKAPKAKLTMFLVSQPAHTAKDASRVRVVPGVTDAGKGFSLIGDDRATIPELLAHEAGHYVGMSARFPDGFPDLLTGDTTRLMYQPSGAAAKIPYDHAADFFNPPARKK